MRNTKHRTINQGPRGKMKKWRREGTGRPKFVNALAMQELMRQMHGLTNFNTNYLQSVMAQVVADVQEKFRQRRSNHG